MSTVPASGIAPTVTLVSGPEDFLADRAVRAAVAAAREGSPDGNVDVRETEVAQLPPGGLNALVTPSLFEEHAVVVVRGLQEAQEPFVEDVRAFLADPPVGCSLVLVHPGGVKGKRALEALRQAGGRALREIACADVKTRRDRLRFLSDEVRMHRRRATEEALATLLDALGGDLRTLSAAVSQLVSDVEGLLDGEAVLRYYSGRAEVSGFVVADRVLEGRTADALELLRWSLRSGTDPVPLLAALAAGLRNVVAVASAPRGLSAGDLARSVGMPPWKVDVVRRQVSGWSPEGLAAGFTALAAADAQVKGGGLDPVYALEHAIMKISRLRGT